MGVLFLGKGNSWIMNEVRTPVRRFEDLIAWQEARGLTREVYRLAREVPVAPEIRDRAVALTLATHPDHAAAPPAVKKYVRFGSSPRGAQSLVLAAKVAAILDGRFHVAKADLHTAAPAVLRHRLILNFEGQAGGVGADDVISEVVGV